MTDSELFKYDVRVRERMLRKGLIEEAEVSKRLDGLPDLEGKYIEFDLKQPALRHETEAPAPRPAPAPAPAPSVAAAPPAPYEAPLSNEGALADASEDDLDEDLDEDEDEDMADKAEGGAGAESSLEEDSGEEP